MSTSARGEITFATVEEALEDIAAGRMVVVVDDGHAVDGPDGVAASIARATGVPVMLARLTEIGA